MSLLTFVAFLVRDVHPFTDVIGAPSIPFLVVIAACVRDFVWWAMSQTVSSILFTPLALCLVDLVWFELDASPAATPWTCFIRSTG